jgi:hypothetical protein
MRGGGPGDCGRMGPPLGVDCGLPAQSRAGEAAPSHPPTRRSGGLRGLSLWEATVRNT